MSFALGLSSYNMRTFSRTITKLSIAAFLWIVLMGVSRRMALHYHLALLELLIFLGMEVIIEQKFWSCTFIWFRGRVINILS